MDGYTHPTNTRAALREALAQYEGDRPPSWFGCQQSYVVHDTNGDDATNLAERHLTGCVDAGLLLHSGIMHGPDHHLGGTEREFKIGPRGLSAGLDPDEPSGLMVADHLMFARWLLVRTAQESRVKVAFTKAALTFSTSAMRVDRGALEAFTASPPPILDGMPDARSHLNPKIELRHGVTREGDVGYGYIRIPEMMPFHDPWAMIHHVITCTYQNRTES